MADQASNSRTVAILWFVAAGLAFVAVGIRFSADSTPGLGVAAGGLFCLVMGVAAWSRSRPSPPA